MSRSITLDPQSAHAHTSRVGSVCTSEFSQPEPEIPPLISALDFHPDEHVTAQILADLMSTEVSLGQIASAAHTTVESITLWMSRPEISARLDAMEAALARRIRIVVANRAQAVLDACARIITDFHESESSFPCDKGNARGLALHIANRNTALQASRLITALGAHYSQPPASRRAPRHAPILAPTPPSSSGPNPNRPPSPLDASVPPASMPSSPSTSPASNSNIQSAHSEHAVLPTRNVSTAPPPAPA